MDDDDQALVRYLRRMSNSSPSHRPIRHIFILGGLRLTGCILKEEILMSHMQICQAWKD